MIEYFKENLQLYILLFVWIIIGMISPLASYVIIPLSVLLMYKKGMFEELFMGYLLILILSDSLEYSLDFAKNVKNIYAVLLAVFILFDTDKFQPLNKLYKIFIPFFLFSFFTFLDSVQEPYVFASLQKTISYLLSFIIVPNFILKLYREHGELFFRRFIFFLAGVLIAGLILKYVAFNVAYLENGRYRGVFGNPNGIGLFAFLTYICLFVLDDFFPNILSRVEHGFIVIIILYSEYLCGSRNSVVAILIFYFFQRFFGFSPFIGFVVFLILIVLSEVISNNFIRVILALNLGDFFRVKTLEEGSGRYIAWNFAWNQIQNNFFVGKGFAYNEYYMRQNYGLLQKLGHQGGIHNSFLTFWMDQGLIGLIIYLRSYILMFIKAAQKTKYAFPIMFAISFTAMFESWLVGSLSAYAFLGMVVFTVITSEEIVAQTTELELEPVTQ